MSWTYEQLAPYFTHTSIELFGVHHSVLENNKIYNGHVNKPTVYCALIIALEGEAEFVFDQHERHLLLPGKVLLGGAGRQLEISTRENGLRYVLIHYYPIRETSGQYDRHPKDVSVLNVSLKPELFTLIDKLLEVAAVPDVMGLLVKKSVFYQVITYVLQSQRQEQNKNIYPVIEDAIAYIHTRFMDSLTLTCLAERYKLTPKYFSHLFHKYTGTGPIEYLIQYRMNKAHEWLQTKQFSVAVVARSVGYSDPYYFSRLFKKYKGIAPSYIGVQTNTIDRSNNKLI